MLARQIMKRVKVVLPSVKCREMQWKLNSVEVAGVGGETWIQLSTGKEKHQCFY